MRRLRSLLGTHPPRGVRTGFASALPATAACSAWLAAACLGVPGCKKSPVDSEVHPPPYAAQRDGSAVPGTDAGAARKPTGSAAGSAQPATMPFALVAIEEVAQLHKLLDGGVLAATGGALHALDREGGVRSLDSVFFALKDSLGDLGSVGGTWPGTLLVETFRLGSGDGITTSFIVEGGPQRAVVKRRMTGSYWLPPERWKGQALLSVRADGHSTGFGTPLDRSARLERLGAAGSPPPRLPKGALFDDAFVAYPSGHVFLLGGRRSRPVVDVASEYEQEHGYMLDGALVWQTDGTTAELRPVQLPDTSPRDRLRSGHLARGQDAHATLVFGFLERWRDRQSTEEPYLARWGRAGWQRIAIDTPVLRIDTGSDGSTWAICGSDGFGSTDESFLARVTPAADGRVTLTRTPLAPRPEWTALSEPTTTLLSGCRKLRPRELAVVREDDRWLTAQCLHDRDYPPTVLLHTQAQKPLVEFKTFERSPPPPR